MCRIDYGSDGWQFLSAHLRTARKPHKCCDCGRAIEPGERYEDARGVYDGNIDRYDTCARCLAAGRWLRIVCGGYLYEGIGEEIVEHWDEERWTPGFPWLGLGRLAWFARSRWARRDGSLLTPDEIASVVYAALPTTYRRQVAITALCHAFGWRPQPAHLWEATARLNAELAA